MSQELDLDLVRFNNATPYPGTRLFEMAKAEGRLNVQGEYENFCSVSTFIENPFRKIPLSYVPQGATANELRYDILVSYLAFYFNWHRLKKIFAKPDTNAGWFVAGRSCVAVLEKSAGAGGLGLADDDQVHRAVLRHLAGQEHEAYFPRVIWAAASAG